MLVPDGVSTRDCPVLQFNSVEPPFQSCEISVCHDGAYKNCGLLGCDAV
jgi:hypothetical protein